MASCNIPIPCDSSVSAANQAAFSITNQGDEGTAIRAHADSGVGVTGTSITGQGIIGRSEGAAGSFFPIGVVGSCPRGGVGVFGAGAPEGLGVFGVALRHGDVGVLGRSPGGPGVRGEATVGPLSTNFGVEGLGMTVQEAAPTTNVGVRGIGANGNFRNVGVLGIGSHPPDSDAVTIGIYGRGARSFPWGLAGLFDGNVQVIGDLTKSGGGFKIDHPLDPANKYLSHSFVESAERKNVYDGIAVLDAKGEGTVDLPEWVETLNSDFRYQLTSIGGPAPNLHVAREISKNRFTIAGGTAKMKVSWQVTGIRRDAWAVGHPLAVEESKSANECGYYLHPELYRQPPENSTLWMGRADLMRQVEEPAEDLPGTENLMEKVTYLTNKMERIRSDDESKGG